MLSDIAEVRSALSDSSLPHGLHRAKLIPNALSIMAATSTELLMFAIDHYDPVPIKPERDRIARIAAIDRKDGDMLFSKDDPQMWQPRIDDRFQLR